MGKIQLRTKEQQIIWDEIKQNTFLSSQFYFTGGTALSSVYLNHRESDDLDFFTSEKFDSQVIFSFIEEWSKKYHFTFTANFVEVVYIFILHFAQGDLKVDFSYYPYKRLGQEMIIDRVHIDSLVDIAVNKLLTISQRSEVKDFVDLYFLLQKFSLWDLIEGVSKKFNVDVDPILLASDFLKIEDFDVLPRLIQPVSLEELKKFFRALAQNLGRRSLK